MKTKTKHACPPAKRGSALLLSTILLFVVLSMVVSLSYVTVMEQQMSSKTKSSVGSFFNADSGVEWALNKIATTTATNISGAFGATSPVNGFAPAGVTEYVVYLLDRDGKVITNSNELIENIKAVRSVGTQDTGEVTQRAIEAAVAAASIDLLTASDSEVDIGGCGSWETLNMGVWMINCGSRYCASKGYKTGFIEETATDNLVACFR